MTSSKGVGKFFCVLELAQRTAAQPATTKDSESMMPQAWLGGATSLDRDLEEALAVRQQQRLEEQWSVGLTGGSYGMHTRHVTTVPPSPGGKRTTRATIGCESPVIASAHALGLSPEAGPPLVSMKPSKAPSDFKPVLPDNSFDRQSAWSREPMGNAKRDHKPPVRLRGEAGEKRLHAALARSVAILDSTGPNIASGPVPRDGITTDAYEAYTRAKLSEMKSAPRTIASSRRKKPTTRATRS